MLEGIYPPKELSYASSVLRFVNSPNDDGNSPVNRFFLISSLQINFINPKEDGILPVNEFLCKPRWNITGKVPIELGMVPVRELKNNCSVKILVKRDTDDGMLLLRRLFCNCTTLKAVSDPIDAEIVPFRFLPPRISLETRPPEQATPVQEHTVSTGNPFG